MVTYKDVQDAEEGKKMIEDKRAEEKAHSILNSELFQQEAEVKQLEAQGQSDDVQAIAEDAVQHMQQLEQQGQDPMGFLQQLPPEVQERITQLLNGQQPVPEGQEPPQQEMAEGQPQQGQPQQGNNPMADLTAMSKQLAGGM